MRLSDIIHGIAITDRRGRLDGEIGGITSDSRQVKAGDLFVAVRGLSSDGHDFVGHAVKRGASAVVCEGWTKDLDGKLETTPDVVLVPNSRRAVALTAANFYGQPSRQMHIAGVTGTNGKTTVTYVLESIMKAGSRKVGVIGTVETRYGDRRAAAAMTTPDAVVIQRTLSEMREAGVTHVAMEVSSHALDQQRVAGVHFKVAGFTNLTQDHLDYHKTLGTYFEAKARLFSDALRKSRARGRMAVVNVDDERGEEMIARWGGKSLRVSMRPDSDAEVVALEWQGDLTGTRIRVRTPKGVWDLQSPLIGAHNVSNVLVAMGMALAMGFSKTRIVRGLKALERVPGRLEPVPNEEGKRVFVDYAHTPDALARVLAALRPLTPGRLIVVFGCGGDRDPDKRGPMGKAVAEGSDLAIVTNDNPRSEDPKTIAAAVAAGLVEGGFAPLEGAVANKRFSTVLDRREAIRAALEWAGEGDCVLIAGKGHENYQIIGKERRSFDDRDETRRILAGLPPPLPTADELETKEELEALAPPPVRTDTSEILVDQIEEVEAASVEDVSAVEEMDPASIDEVLEAEAVAEAEEVAADEVEEIEEAASGPPEDEKT